MSAQPYVDYRAKILTVSRDQQASIMGRSNLAMVESGLVDWSDVVTPSRVRSLREVASRKRLTVDQMVGSGVTRGRAEEAWNAVHTATHTASEARRQEQVKALLNKGYTRQQVLDAAGNAIGSRIGIVEGPSGASVVPYTPKPTPRPVPVVPARVAALATAKPKPKPFGPSRATQEGDSKEQLALLGELKTLTGRSFTAAELASAAGVPDNATYEVIRENGHPGTVVFSGPGYEGSRTVRRRGDGKLVVHNDAFLVDEDHQGQGIGAAMFGRQVEQASELGFDLIETEATGYHGHHTYNGYAIWPKFGYDGDLPARLPPLPESLAGSKRVSDLMRTPEGRDWWNLNGSTFSATFDLEPGSTSREVWDAYRARKARGDKP